jgi:hypothetical protein
LSELIFDNSSTFSPIQNTMPWLFRKLSNLELETTAR